MTVDPRENRIRGCLMGLAAGDAMGRPVERMKCEEIRQCYGSGGLQGYDLMNGMAEVSSYTQIAAFCCNGLLLALTQGHTKLLTRYLTLAQTEWATSQRYYRFPEKPRCWVGHVPALRGRYCPDSRTQDNIARGAFGSVLSPANNLCGPLPLPAAMVAGLYFHPERMAVDAIGKLGAQTVALSQGHPMAFLSGAVLAYLTAGLIQDGDTPLKEQVLQAAAAVSAQFSQFPQAAQLEEMLRDVVQKATYPNMPPQKVMEKLQCSDAHRVLCGGIFAALIAQKDFDTALVTAVNHSGASSATAAIAGGILGAALGEQALPDFYLENLEARVPMGQLAADLCQSSPTGQLMRLFDDDWDRKYIQGEPVEV